MKNKNIWKKITSMREFGVILALFILVAIFAASSPIFWTPENLLNITRQVSVISLLAISMVLVIITGGIDLSVESIIAFSGIITASIMKDYNLPISIAIIIGVLSGALAGVLNGFLIAYINMPAFITTMGTMTMLRGLGYIYTKAYPIYGLPLSFKLIGQGYLGIIPVPSIILLFVAICVYVLLRKTIYGRHLYAIGGNKEASELAGIRVKRNVFIVYVLSGFIAGIAAVIQTARIGAGMPTIGEGFALQAVAAVVIGGAAMAGGSGTILGTILGSIVLGVLSNGLSLLDVDSYIMQVVSGLVVILAVLLDQIRILMSKRSQVKSTIQGLQRDTEGAL